MKGKQLYENAIKKWGVSLQLIMIIEEMSELTKEIVKVLRGKTDSEKLSEEMADVEIMLEQIRVMFDNSRTIEKYKNKKLRRLSKLVKVKP